MIGMFRYLVGILEEEERKAFKALIVLNLISPIMDLFGFSIIVYILNEVIREQHVSNEIVVITFFMGSVMIVKGLFDLFKCRIQSQFIYGGTQKLSLKLYELLIKERLMSHNKKNPIYAVTLVRNDAQNCMRIVVSGIEICVSILMIIGYYAVIIYVSSWFGILSCMVFTLFIIGLFLYYRSQMKSFGEKSRKSGIKTNAQITIAYGSFKEMKISDRSATMLHKYQNASGEYAWLQKEYQQNRAIVSMIMQNLIMTIAFIVLGCILLNPEEKISYLLASMVVYLTILLRMMPMANNIVNGLNDVEYLQKSYKEVRAALADFMEIKKEEEESKRIRQKRISFQKGLFVENLTFSYDGHANIFEAAAIDIPAGCSVAVIGISGIGKTTFLDLILGLLHPKEGHIWYDDYDIVTHMDGDGICRADIGDVASYIPQTVYLNGETIRNNVALFVEDREIDELRVEECLKCAQIWEDIIKMPDGLNTLIGENGITVSGGQRQRIALARALYKEFELLIMDEATAALDLETEKAIIDSIRQIKGRKTILVSTHHPSLANECDLIYKIENKRFIRIK
jgi:ABC-type bacteriocin/lantibiotic exporter with double-glycine peptidase domain